MDTGAAAHNFAISAGSLIPDEVVEIPQAASTSASVAATGSTTASATAATVTAPVATAVNPPCGCEKNCLAKFSWEEIQQQQFLMQELEKTEKRCSSWACFCLNRICQLRLDVESVNTQPICILTKGRRSAPGHSEQFTSSRSI